MSEPARMTLADFLLARIDHERRWYEHRGGACMCPMNSPEWSSRDHRPGCPRRVLAECEAKRRIVEIHSDVYGDGGCTGCGFGSDEERMNTVGECPTLRALAQPYADHPGFREEWRPNGDELPLDQYGPTGDYGDETPRRD